MSNIDLQTPSMVRIAIARLRLTIAVFGLAFALVACNAGERSKRISDEIERIEIPDLGAVEGVNEAWSRDLGEGVGDRYLDLIVAQVGDVVYGADSSGLVVAINADDGAIVWSTDLEKPISAGVGVGDGHVFAADSDGHVYALDAATGELNWKVNAGGEVLAAPVVDSATVVVRTVSGRVTALRIADGARRWAYQRTVPALSLRGTAPPAVYDGVLLTSFASGKLVANEIESGTILWEYDVVAPTGRNEIDRMVDLDATPVLVGSVVYLAAFQGEILALALGSRKVLWSKPVSSYRDIAVDEDLVYVANDDGEIIALDRLSGQERWTQVALRGHTDTAPTIVSSYVLVGDKDGRLHFLDQDTGEFVGQLATKKSIVGQLVNVKDRVYAVSAGGRLMAIDVRPPG